MPSSWIKRITALLLLVFSCGSPEIPKQITNKPGTKTSKVKEYKINFVEYSPGEFDNFEGKIWLYADSIILSSKGSKESVKIIKTLAADTFNILKHDSIPVLNTYTKLLCLHKNTNTILPNNAAHYQISITTSGDNLLYIYIIENSADGRILKNVRYFQEIEEQNSDRSIKTKYHVAVPGDTWESIARKYNVNSSTLKEYNPGKRVPSGTLLIP